MPFRSIKQMKWGHTPEGQAALGGPSAVKEWDSASKGRNLPMYAKGSKPQDASYARGGSVLGKESEFMKTPDRFLGHKAGPLKDNKTEDDYEKTGAGGKLSKLTGDKSLKAVKPRT